MITPNFSTRVEGTGTGTVIHVSGEIDIATCERLRDVIEQHLGPRQTIVLDLSAIKFMDSLRCTYLHRRGRS